MRAGRAALVLVLMSFSSGCEEEQPGHSVATGGTTSAGTGGSDGSALGGASSGGTPSGGAAGSSSTGGGSGGTASGGGGTAGSSAGGTGGLACATLLLSEDFEDGKFTDTLKHEAGAGAVAVVSAAGGADVYAGERCLRGNFKTGYKDPLTALTAPTRYTGLEIPLGGIERFYVSLRYRVDADAKWVMDDGQDTALGYKFFYLMGTPWDNTLNWVLSQLWGSDHWSFVDNQPQGNTNFSAKANVGSSAGELGKWHHIELVAELNSAPGAKDGRFALRVDDQLAIDRNDVPYQTKSAQTFGTLGGIPHMYGGCCGAKYPFGWQIDELRVWVLPSGCKPF